MNKIREDISKWPIEKRVEVLKKAFKEKMGYDLDLENPRTFSEKIQWMKLFYHDPNMSRCADKVTFKDYIKEKLGRDDYTAKLYKVWESPDEVDLESIPDKCVIKSNCSSDGWNIVLVDDKSRLDLKAVEKEIKEGWFDRLALHTNSFANYYYDVKPKVYVEEYLADFASGADDYDVLCFHGEPKVLCVKSNHFDNGKNLLDYPYTFYSTEWERLDVKYAINPTLDEVKRPPHLDEMLAVSRKLSKDFPFVRVDFYEHAGKLRIAEFSFAPYAGLVHYEPEEFDREMGEWLDLEESTKGMISVKHHIVDMAINWVKDRASIEDMDGFIGKLVRYPHRISADLNEIKDALTICFGKEEREIFLLNQASIKEGDNIICKNKKYEVVTVYRKKYSTYDFQSVDWK